MNESKYITITPEVTVDDKILYLIRMDKEEMIFVNTEHEAQLVIDSIAAAESKRLKDKWTKVFRQDLEIEQKIVLSTQALGVMMNGAITKVCTIDYIPVGHAILTKGRLALTASMISTEELVLIPLPAVLERLCKSETEDVKEKSEEDDKSDDETEEVE